MVKLGSSGKAVTWKEHCCWLEKILKDKEKSALFIIEINDVPAGQVRFELIKNAMYSVSIYLAEKYTGKSFGVVALQRGLECMLQKVRNASFIAFIKKDNGFSFSAFSKAGFYKIKDFAGTPSGHIAMIYNQQEKQSSRNMGAIVNFYDKNVKQFKDNIKSVGWGSKASQEKRFLVFSCIDKLEKKSILDVGCGIGDFYGWLKERYKKREYTGIDITPSMVEFASKKYPEIEFKVMNILDMTETTPVCDYAFASGIFNLRIPQHELFLKSTIQKMFLLSREGIAFNIMSTKADFFEKKEYYADPGKMLNFCLDLSRRVVLRHDYMPHDFTVYVYKK